MPAPDPRGITAAENWPKGVITERWAHGNPAHRQARARRILHNARFGEWSCLECLEPVPFTHRADAIYCCERCRKKAQRRRRKGRA